MTRTLKELQCKASWSPMKSLLWVLASPMLHVIAFVTALVCVTVGTILGHLTPQQPSAMANGAVENLHFKDEATSSEHGPQQPTSSGTPSEEAKAVREGDEVLREMSRSPSVQKERSEQEPPEKGPTPLCRPFPHKTLEDIEDRDLTYAMMAKLSLAAAEEHMGKLAKDAGIVALYAKRAAKAFARLRLLVGDKLTDLVARKPWIVPEMAAMETKRCGHVVPDGPTARAMAAVDALTYVEQSMALVPLFDGTDLRELQAAAEDGEASVRRRLSYQDEGQGVLLGHALH